jgi:4-hydroxy-tetrahydrodipicolinate synthase
VKPDLRPSTFCCSITTFASDGALDEAALRAHLRRLADAGVGVYVAGSSPGEGYALSRDELRRCLEIAVEEIGDRVPVRAMGVEPRSASQMVDFVRLAADAGVHAVQLYSLDIGHGGRPGAETLERYFRTAIEAARTPCVVSSHFFGGYVLEPELVARLAQDYEHLIGVNVTSPEIPYLVRVLDAVGGRAAVHVGGPMHALTALALGAQGYLSSESNYAPRTAQRVIERWVAGEHRAAFEAWALLVRLMTGMGDVPGMSVRYVKAMLGAQGSAGTGLREPHLPLTAEERARAGKRLASLGIPELEARLEPV